MVAARNSAPTNVDECKGVNMHLNSDVSMNASTLAKEPVDTNEKTMGDLHVGIDISMGLLLGPWHGTTGSECLSEDRLILSVSYRRIFLIRFLIEARHQLA